MEAVRSMLKRKKVRQPFSEVLRELDIAPLAVVDEEIEDYVAAVLADLVSWEEATLHLTPIEFGEPRRNIPALSDAGVLISAALAIEA